MFNLGDGLISKLATVGVVVGLIAKGFSSSTILIYISNYEVSGDFDRDPQVEMLSVRVFLH